MAMSIKKGAPPHARHSVGPFWWRDVISLSDNYFMIASCKVQRGTQFNFGKIFGIWVSCTGDFHNFTHMPKMSRFQPKPFCPTHPSEISGCPCQHRPPHNGLNFKAFSIVQIEPLQNDRWTYICGSSDFTSKKANTNLSGFKPASPLFKWMRKFNVKNKHKLFFGCCSGTYQTQEIYSEGKI